MGQGANILFNLLTITFLVLTVLTGVVIVGVATGSMEPPILAPEATVIPPTALESIPTLTPSSVPGMELTPDQTLTPEAPSQ